MSHWASGLIVLPDLYSRKGVVTFAALLRNRRTEIRMNATKWGGAVSRACVLHSRGVGIAMNRSDVPCREFTFGCFRHAAPKRLNLLSFDSSL